MIACIAGKGSETIEIGEGIKAQLHNEDEFISYVSGMQFVKKKKKHELIAL